MAELEALTQQLAAANDKCKSQAHELQSAKQRAVKSIKSKYEGWSPERAFRVWNERWVRDARGWTRGVRDGEVAEEPVELQVSNTSIVFICVEMIIFVVEFKSNYGRN